MLNLLFELDQFVNFMLLCLSYANTRAKVLQEN